MMTFQSSISSLLEIADSAGKTVTSDEVFDGNRMNVFRVAVFFSINAFSANVNIAIAVTCFIAAIENVNVPNAKNRNIANGMQLFHY